MNQKVNISTELGADVHEVSQAVAGKLKQYRKNKKLSLDELSRRASISKGMLVEIEKGAANPSIAILCKLSAALGVSVADIVNVSSDPAVHVVEPENMPVLWTGANGGIARLLAGTTGPNMIELWRWIIQPGETFMSPGHSAGTFELFHVEAGSLTLKVGSIETIITEGVSAVARTDVPHSYSNETDSSLIFTMTVAELHQ